MTREENYNEFINITCEMLGFNKPIEVLKLCQITSEFVMPYEKRIVELEKENKELKELVEWLKAEKTKFEDETIALEYKVEELIRRI